MPKTKKSDLRAAIELASGSPVECNEVEAYGLVLSTSVNGTKVQARGYSEREALFSLMGAVRVARAMQGDPLAVDDQFRSTADA